MISVLWLTAFSQHVFNYVQLSVRKLIAIISYRIIMFFLVWFSSDEYISYIYINLQFFIYINPYIYVYIYIYRYIYTQVGYIYIVQVYIHIVYCFHFFINCRPLKSMIYTLSWNFKKHIKTIYFTHIYMYTLYNQ